MQKKQNKCSLKLPTNWNVERVLANCFLCLQILAISHLK